MTTQRGSVDYIIDKVKYENAKSLKSFNDAYKFGLQFADDGHARSIEKVIRLALTVRVTGKYDIVAYRVGLVCGYLWKEKYKGRISKEEFLTADDLLRLGVRY